VCCAVLYCAVLYCGAHLSSLHAFPLESSAITSAVPIGIKDYITPYDVCSAMPELREYLKTSPLSGNGSPQVSK
jgi:hypothetical protein